MKDGLRKQIEEELQTEERSKTDLALIEEALRYGNVLDPKGILVYRSSFSFSFFPDWTPEGEYYDYFGVVCETIQGETPVTRLELLEVNNGCNEVRRAELNSVQTKPQEVRGWEEDSWEESDLARFNNFLGFPQRDWRKLFWIFWLKSEREGKEFTAKLFWRNLNSKMN